MKRSIKHGAPSKRSPRRAAEAVDEKAKEENPGPRYGSQAGGAQVGACTCGHARRGRQKETARKAQEELAQRCRRGLIVGRFAQVQTGPSFSILNQASEPAHVLPGETALPAKSCAPRRVRQRWSPDPLVRSPYC